MYRDRSQENIGFVQILARAGLFTVIGMTITLMATLVMAFFISRGSVGIESAGYCALCCLAGSSLSGFFTAGYARRHMLLWGGAAGAMFVLLLIIINALFLPSLSTGGSFGGVIITSLGGALIGSILRAMLRK